MIWVVFVVIFVGVMSIKQSLPFEIEGIDFKCRSVLCTYPKIMKNSLFHIVVGTAHVSYFPLLVNRVCEAFQSCIGVGNMKIILHSENEESVNSSAFLQGSEFLNRLYIPYTTWVGTFTADRKMLQTFKLLKEYNSSTYVYQTDIDEVPDSRTLASAMLELKRGECDAIKATWVDRLSIDGTLNPVKLQGDWTLAQQFPLRCRISPQFVGSRTEKVIMYNAAYRIDGGHHEVWCSPLQGTFMKSIDTIHNKIDINNNSSHLNSLNANNNNHTDAFVLSNNNNSIKKLEYYDICKKHIKGRNKHKFAYDIISALPINTYQPAKYCKTTVLLDHYKFVDGIQSYLKTRYVTYKEKGLYWWTDSWRFLTHIERHHNSICVNCKVSQCFNTLNSTIVEADPDKSFWCGRGAQPCVDLLGRKIIDIDPTYKRGRRPIPNP